MRKIRSILIGWYYYLFTTREVRKMAKPRYRKCRKCPMKKDGLYPKFKDKAFPEIGGSHCALCGCLLSAKIRSSKEVCPDEPARW